MANEDLKALELFFVRPLESIYLPKGKDQVRLRIPESLQPADNKDPIKGRFKGKSGKEIVVKDVKKPNISRAMKLCKEDCFSTMFTEHREMAQQLIDCFTKAKNLKELISLCAYARLSCNPFLFNHSLIAAVRERRDTKELRIPTYFEMFPHLFLDSRSIDLARQKMTDLALTSEPADKGADKKDPDPVKIVIQPTASNELPEQHVAYFREDIGLNLVNLNWNNANKDKQFVRKRLDREGEIFYYFNQQIIARYRNERICNKLERMQPLENLHEPIPEAYFPKLYSIGVTQPYPPRPENMLPADIDRLDGEVRFNVSIEQLEEYRDSIVEAIVAGYAIKADGTEIPLDEVTGINVLGQILRGEEMTPNKERYGNLVTDGLLLLSYIHDPKGLYLENVAVVTPYATCLRDPLYYRWIMFINEIFLIHKDQLKQYEYDELNFPGITVSSIKIESSEHEDPPNQISTHKERNLIDLEHGLELYPLLKNHVQAQLDYLQHNDFNYVIEVNNDTNEEQTGTVRIFMAPMNDEDGKELGFNDQRKLMIELDKFSQTLQPGKNTINRKSLDSSVTLPYDSLFPDKKIETSCGDNDFHCKCGWPPYMLVPKGTTDGHPMELFVMITNHNDDKVEDEEQPASSKYMGSPSYCGELNKKYPDKRAMGFPFDRYNDACFLVDFCQPNMATQKCTIKYTEKVVDRPKH